MFVAMFRKLSFDGSEHCAVDCDVVAICGTTVLAMAVI